MKNHLFRFKQFELKQEKSAMKIGTDGVLIGAWASHQQPQNILDIGTGTGLIAMMMAQRFPQAQIVGLEIEPDAANEALENVQQSQFHHKINIVNQSLQKFDTSQKFDLIVSNPPFFEINVDQNSTRKTARQQSDLSFEDLIQRVDDLIETNGRFAVIIPYDQTEKLIQIGEKHTLYVQQILYVKGTEVSPIKRSMILFGKSKIEPLFDELIIEIDRHIYTQKYINLTQDFYLKM